MARTRRARARSKVRLNAAALWKLLARFDHAQNWLAGEVGVTSGYISMLINGQLGPSPLVRRRMLWALSVSYEQLVTMVPADDDHQ